MKNIYRYHEASDNNEMDACCEHEHGHEGKHEHEHGSCCGHKHEHEGEHDHEHGSCCGHKHEHEEEHDHEPGSCCGHKHEHEHDHEHGSCCGHHHHEIEDEEDFDNDPMVQIIDEETGETFDFFIGDEFEHEDQLYYVLVPAEEEPSVYVIGKVIIEDDEAFIETLTDEENDVVYDVYDQILADYFADEELNEEA